MSQPSRSLRLRHSMRTSVSVSLMIPAQTIASLNALWSGSPFTIGTALKLIVLSVFQNTVNVLFVSLIILNPYSHSWHMNQSVSVHSLASSRVMRSSSLQPQQDTSTLSVVTWPLSIGWTISLVFIFISLFLSLTCYIVSQFTLKVNTYLQLSQLILWFF